MEYKKIKTFKNACKALKIDSTAVPDFSMIPKVHRKALESHYKLVIIAEAINEGWKPDWSNMDEPKYTPWLKVVDDDIKPSGFGLSYGDCDYWFTVTAVGSRLCYESLDKAEYAFETFRGLYEDYMLIG